MLFISHIFFPLFDMTSATNHVKIFENMKEEYKRACFCFKAKHHCQSEQTVAVVFTYLYKALKL
jgi:hypothetical protein